MALLNRSGAVLRLNREAERLLGLELGVVAKRLGSTATVLGGDVGSTLGPPES